MADYKLSGELVLDDSALENIEEKQLEIAGEPDSVGEAKELNESQDERLMVANRKLGRISTRLGTLGVIAAALALVAKIVGEVFNIGFEDVRNGIVNAIDAVIDAIKSFIPGLGGQGRERFQPPTSEELGFAAQAGTGNPVYGFPRAIASLVGGRAADMESNPGGRTSMDNREQPLNVNLLTSRDSLTGDSTQQEMESNSINDIVFNGGS